MLHPGVVAPWTRAEVTGVLLRGKNPRPALALLASSVAVLLIAAATAAHDVATDPQPTRVVTVGAAAAHGRL